MTTTRRPKGDCGGLPGEVWTRFIARRIRACRWRAGRNSQAGGFFRTCSRTRRKPSAAPQPSAARQSRGSIPAGGAIDRAGAASARLCRLPPRTVREAGRRLDGWLVDRFFPLTLVTSRSRRSPPTIEYNCFQTDWPQVLHACALHLAPGRFAADHSRWRVTRRPSEPDSTGGGGAVHRRGRRSDPIAWSVPTDDRRELHLIAQSMSRHSHDRR